MRMEIKPVRWVNVTPQDIETLKPIKDLAAGLNGRVNNHQDLKAMLEGIVNALKNLPK